MPEFIYLMHPYRHEFYEQPTADELDVIDAHLRYLDQAKHKGIVLAAGSCLDETFSLVIITAINENIAQSFMFNDPAVRCNVMMAELHPLKIDLGSE